MHPQGAPVGRDTIGHRRGAQHHATGRVQPAASLGTARGHRSRLSHPRSPSRGDGATPWPRAETRPEPRRARESGKPVLAPEVYATILTGPPPWGPGATRDPPRRLPQVPRPRTLTQRRRRRAPPLTPIPPWKRLSVALRGRNQHHTRVIPACYFASGTTTPAPRALWRTSSSLTACSSARFGKR